MSMKDVERFRKFADGGKDFADAAVMPVPAATVLSSVRPGEDEKTTTDGLPTDGKEAVYLPSGDVQISDTAEAVFTVLARKHELYVRGGAVVETRRQKDGRLVLEVVRAPGLRTRAEKYCRFLAWRAGGGERRLEPRTMPTEIAEALLQSREARLFLPEITGVSNCPVFRERNGRLEIVGPGYDEESGLLIVKGGEPLPVTLDEARKSLCQLFADSRFKTPADFSRAMAMLFTPALKSSGLIVGPVPIDVSEADQSQAGKNYRLKLTSALYNDTLALVTKRQGGVGSMDETFCHHLVAGRRFIVFDNVRGVLDSQMLESFKTADGDFSARVPHRGSIDVDPSKFFVSMTSNGAETTPDLANRGCIVRICKQPDGYRYTLYPEGDVLAHVRANQPYYLGCVFSVIEAWVRCGKVPLASADHDFQDWARVAGSIVQNMFVTAPLLEGHRAAQKRVGNVALTFLRMVALAHLRKGGCGKSQIAADLAILCQEEGIAIPGLSSGQDVEAAAKQIGVLMKRAFGSDDQTRIEIDGVVVERQAMNVARQDGKGTRPQKSYVFRRGEMHPDLSR